ncbi:hypothetical protein FHS35_009247 [Streptomyces umbrinus]|uniref:hypothetical protein n=1 Tax=Streptomyces umbrinus TaxID=67370 RepID=UPI00167CAF43|nr:hypothetical protein [Streptomyces umbrinus]MCR3732329.1 hypothetical protein [Streptomyces umbrinus]GHH68041.1 hypothetical protein GCM10018775_92290 [Streptomyces umbrinus]
MPVLSEPPLGSSPAPRLPAWLRIAPGAAFVLAAGFGVETTRQLLTGPTAGTSAWATMAAGCTAAWLGLLTYGARLREPC